MVSRGPCFQTKNRQAKSTNFRVFRRRIRQLYTETTTSHPSATQCNFQQLPFTTSAGFLGSGGQNSAFDSRFLLILAGDVEENPGPKIQQKRRCYPCSKTIRVDHDDVKCCSPGCHNISHKSPKCTRISRYKPKDNWICDDHNTNIAAAQAPEAESDTAPRKKRYCSQKGCGIICKKGSGEFQCNKCLRYFHQDCTGLSRAARADIKARKAEWTCPKCEDEANVVPPSIPTFIEESIESAGSTSGTTKDTLRIIQWNADTISTKALELQDRLVKDDIDICLIQESKLSENSRTPRFQGYVGIRADRKLKNIGGGLLTLIKSSLIYETLDPVAIEGTETQSVRVKMDKKNWIYITNVYVPPGNSIGQDSIKLRTDAIPAFKSSLICGDFNAHSVLWDSIQPTDDRGEHVLDFAIDRELTILNDG